MSCLPNQTKPNQTEQQQQQLNLQLVMVAMMQSRFLQIQQQQQQHKCLQLLATSNLILKSLITTKTSKKKTVSKRI